MTKITSQQERHRRIEHRILVPIKFLRQADESLWVNNYSVSRIILAWQSRAATIRGLIFAAKVFCCVYFVGESSSGETLLRHETLDPTANRGAFMHFQRLCATVEKLSWRNRPTQTDVKSCYRPLSRPTFTDKVL